MGAVFFPPMTYTQNLMEIPESQYNFACLNGEFFSKIGFFNLWAKFKVNSFTLKKMQFSSNFLIHEFVPDFVCTLLTSNFGS